MGLPRFLVDRFDEQGLVQLGQTESHHAARVLRLTVGDRCVVFDGRGFEAHGTIESLDKKSVYVRHQSQTFAPRDHGGQLEFAIAMPKGDRQRNVIEKLIELGVDRLTPIETQRSVSKFDSDAIERLERYGLESCKQSQRNRLMQIDPCCDWKDWLQRVQSDSQCEGWILHPVRSLESALEGGKHVATHATHAIDVANFLAETAPVPVDKKGGRIIFAIGPEGGFTREEVQRSLEAGFKLLDLGERILRVETAVGVAAVLGSLRLSGPVFEPLMDTDER
ncbi:MAG: RsmE family RNA methyltransferase [Planctomycetota bacterium]|jgi:16S rRNA (uracil1498-N3)-methyltransferase